MISTVKPIVTVMNQLYCENQKGIIGVFRTIGKIVKPIQLLKILSTE